MFPKRSFLKLLIFVAAVLFIFSKVSLSGPQLTISGLLKAEIDKLPPDHAKLINLEMPVTIVAAPVMKSPPTTLMALAKGHIVGAVYLKGSFPKYHLTSGIYSIRIRQDKDGFWICDFIGKKGDVKSTVPASVKRSIKSYPHPTAFISMHSPEIIIVWDNIAVEI